MLSKLSLHNRLKVCQEYKVYKGLSFSSRDDSKITCYDLEHKEDCVLEVKSFDDVIDFQNKLYDYIMWSLD